MAEILALDQNGNRLIPLVAGGCSSKEAHLRLAKQKASDLFSGAQAPEAALAGLWAYFSAFEEAHEMAQNIATAEGSYWHAILHRQEPDAGNAAYWFRQVGTHPVFGELREAALEIAKRHAGSGLSVGAHWDPFEFIDFCESARRQPESEAERAALAVQLAEWQLLFDHCARPGA